MVVPVTPLRPRGLDQGRQCPQRRSRDLPRNLKRKTEGEEVVVDDECVQASPRKEQEPIYSTLELGSRRVHADPARQLLEGSDVPILNHLLNQTACDYSVCTIFWGFVSF